MDYEILCGGHEMVQIIIAGGINYAGLTISPHPSARGSDDDAVTLERLMNYGT